jgi:hypothetical protein
MEAPHVRGFFASGTSLNFSNAVSGDKRNKVSRGPLVITIDSALCLAVLRAFQVFLKDLQIGLEQLQGALGLRCIRASLPLGRAILAFCSMTYFCVFTTYFAASKILSKCIGIGERRPK